MEATVVNISIISWSTVRPICNNFIEKIDRALFVVSAKMASAFLKPWSDEDVLNVIHDSPFARSPTSERNLLERCQYSLEWCCVRRPHPQSPQPCPNTFSPFSSVGQQPLLLLAFVRVSVSSCCWPLAQSSKEEYRLSSIWISVSCTVIGLNAQQYLFITNFHDISVGIIIQFITSRPRRSIG